MSKHVVVTSFTPKGWNNYARHFAESYKAHWPSNVPCWLYTHNQEIEGFTCINLPSTEPAKSFLERHSHDMRTHGKVVMSDWTTGERSRGYSFRYDAYKFGRKAFAMAHAARHLTSEKLFWIDADVATMDEVTTEFLDGVLPDEYAMCHLPKSLSEELTEISFVGYNLAHTSARKFIYALESLYATDEFLTHPCWDDGHLFDELLVSMRPKANVLKLKSRPFELSILGSVMRHFRGNAKHDELQVNRYMRKSRQTANKRKAARPNV